MRFNEKYSLRDVAGEKVIVQQGRHGVDMTKIISLNPTAEFLWNSFMGKNFSEEDVANKLIEEYEIDSELAHKDASAWCAKMKELNLL